jgi:glutathione S-transferase
MPTHEVIMKLYGFPLSGNTHKVRLLLSALRLPYEEITVDLTTAAHKQPTFLAVNPRGQVPALDDDGTRLHDAQAILLYLARRYDSSESWAPTRPAELGQVMQWLSFAANEVHNGPHHARLHVLMGAPVPLDFAHAVARGALEVLEQRLRDRDWLELDRPTIADLACFPGVALAPEGRVDLRPYPAIGRWIRRIQGLPFYLSMPGLPPVELAQENQPSLGSS